MVFGHSSVQTALAKRPGFPAAVNPKPLAGMLADNLFKDSVQALGIGCRVARYLKWRMKFEDVSLFVFIPNREAWDDGRSGLGGDLGEGGVGARGGAEEVDEDAFVERRVLIDQDADGFVLMERAQNGSGGVPFGDQVVARKLTALFDHSIDGGIIERADHDVHRLGHQGVGEGAEFPVAEVGGGEEDASASLLGVQKMFQSFVTYPLGNVLAINVRETREDPHQTGDGAENLVGNGAALGGRFLRIGEFEIAHRGAAQAGNGEVEQGGVEAS